MLHEIPCEVRGQPESSTGESRAREEFAYEIVDGRHRFVAACELGLRVLPCRVFPRETELALLLQVGYNQNTLHDQYVPETLYDLLACIIRVEAVLTAKRIEERPELSGKYKPTMAEVASFVSAFNRKLGSGSIGHYRQILRFGPGALEIIKEDSAKLEDAVITKTNAYNDGLTAQALGFGKRKGPLSPSEQSIATRYFEELAKGIVPQGSSKPIPLTKDRALHLATLVKKRVDLERSLESRRDELSERAFTDVRGSIWEGTFDEETDFSKVIERSASRPPTVSEVEETRSSESEVGSPEPMDLDVHPPVDTEVSVEVPEAPRRSEPIAAALPAKKAQILMNDFLTINLQDLGLFDCILTDPPYNILNEARDSFTDDEKKRAFDRMLALLKPHGALIMVCMIHLI